MSLKLTVAEADPSPSLLLKTQEPSSNVEFPTNLLMLSNPAHPDILGAKHLLPLTPMPWVHLVNSFTSVTA